MAREARREPCDRPGRTAIYGAVPTLWQEGVVGRAQQKKSAAAALSLLPWRALRVIFLFVAT